MLNSPLAQYQQNYQNRNSGERGMEESSLVTDPTTGENYFVAKNDLGQMSQNVGSAYWPTVSRPDTYRDVVNLRPAGFDVVNSDYERPQNAFMEGAGRPDWAKSDIDFMKSDQAWQDFQAGKGGLTQSDLQRWVADDMSDFNALPEVVKQGALADPELFLKTKERSRNAENKRLFGFGAEGGVRSASDYKWDPQQGLYFDRSAYMTPDENWYDSLDNAMPVVVRGLMSYFGGPIAGAAMGAMDSYMDKGHVDFGNMAKQAAISYALNEAGNYAGGEAATAATDAGWSPEAASAAKSAASGATKGYLGSGGDLKSAAVGAATGAVGSEYGQLAGQATKYALNEALKEDQQTSRPATQRTPTTQAPTQQVRNQSAQPINTGTSPMGFYNLLSQMYANENQNPDWYRPYG